MKRDYPNLCKPLRVAGVTLRNRICAAPTGATDIYPSGTPGPRTQGFYEDRARGGAAIVTVSEVIVHPETDGSQSLRLSLKTPGQLGAFAYIADAISRHGAIPSLELSHSGQFAGTYIIDKDKQESLCQYGPIDDVRSDGIPVKALTAEQIADITAAYAETAALAVRAGFQMIMVHCGHGWLLNQFLSPYFNKREDEYGGPLENRCRFAKEVFIAIRNAVGPRVPIEMRMSASETFEGGYDIDEGVRIAQELEDYVDVIHVSAGSYKFGFDITHPSMFRDHGCNVRYAAEIKKHVSKPVATLGGLSDPQQMEDIIASGQADIIYMGRGLLCDPDMPNKVMANRGDEILKCMRCFVCMAERAATQTRRCSINPRLGRELEGMEVIPVPACRQKKVLIVGGGIAGLVAAHTAALRGHQVTLCEAQAELGGILRTEQALPFKQQMYELGTTYGRLCERAGVDIRLNTRVDAAWADEFAADAVIVAVGSRPLVLPIPCDEAMPVFNVEQLYLEGAQTGDEVIVIGGGLTGCECALLMAQQGKTAHLVEMRDALAIDANLRHRPFLLASLDEADVDIHVNSTAVEVTADGLRVRDADGNEQLICGTSVICAIGQQSRIDAVEELRDAAPWVRIIGDAARPANITNAVCTAYHAALDI